MCTDVEECELCMCVNEIQRTMFIFIRRKLFDAMCLIHRCVTNDMIIAILFGWHFHQIYLSTVICLGVNMV